MMRLLKISIILLVIVSLGLIVYVDWNYCIQDFYPPGLRFLVCTKIIHLEGLMYPITDLIYEALNPDPQYVNPKTIELKEMPCEEMSKNHVHEIEDEEYSLVYDQKYLECFGSIP